MHKSMHTRFTAGTWLVGLGLGFWLILAAMPAHAADTPFDVTITVVGPHQSIKGTIANRINLPTKPVTATPSLPAKKGARPEISRHGRATSITPSLPSVDDHSFKHLDRSAPNLPTSSAGTPASLPNTQRPDQSPEIEHPQVQAPTVQTPIIQAPNIQTPEIDRPDD